MAALAEGGHGKWASNQIQPPLGDAGAIAVGADAADDEGVPVRLEMMLPADVVNDRADGFILEFDDFAALLTDQVFMGRVAVIVLVEHARSELQPAQQARVHQLRKRPVDRCPANAEASLLHIVDELLGVEMVVLGKDEVDHVALLIGRALRLGPAGQIFPKLALGTVRHFHGGQLHSQTSSICHTRVCGPLTLEWGLQQAIFNNHSYFHYRSQSRLANREWKSIVKLYSRR